MCDKTKRSNDQIIEESGRCPYSDFNSLELMNLKCQIKSLFPAVNNEKHEEHENFRCCMRVRSSSRFLDKLKTASATLEMTLLFPLVLFFFMSVFYLFEMFYVHTQIQGELCNIGNEMVAYSYVFSPAYEDNGDIEDEIGSLVFDKLYVVGRLKKLSVSKRTEGLNAVLSDISLTDSIDLTITYYLKPYISFPGFKGFILCNHFFSKAYTGFFVEASSEDKDTYVYITKSGTVYHTSLECRILKRTITKVPEAELMILRNESGGVYTACEICGKKESLGSVYVTPYGNRYHNSISCSALSKDVLVIKLSEVGNRRKCKCCP